MRSGKIEARVPHPLRDASRKLGAAKGIRSESRHVIYRMLLEHIIANGEHVARAIANADLDVQDKCIDVILKYPTEDREIIKILLADSAVLRATPTRAALLPPVPVTSSGPRRRVSSLPRPKP